MSQQLPQRFKVGMCNIPSFNKMNKRDFKNPKIGANKNFFSSYRFMHIDHLINYFECAIAMMLAYVFSLTLKP
jgi:hypothetical protein